MSPLPSYIAQGYPDGTAQGSTDGDSIASPWLPTWFKAFSNRANAPACAVFIGDSVTEGQGASAMANRFTDVLAANVRQGALSNGRTGGGYLPAYGLTQSPSTWAPSALTGSAAVAGNQLNNAGLGGKGLVMTSAGTITWTFSGDSADICWYGFPAAGSFSYSLDGAGAVTVAMNTSENSAQRTTVTPAAAGTHTIVVNWVSGNAIIEGLQYYDGDRAAGIQILNAGHYGWITANFVDTGDTGTANGTTKLAAFIAAINAASPDLVVIELGGNDWLNDTGSLSPANMATNLQTLITALRAMTKPPDILLMSIYQLPQAMSSSSRTWSQYTAAMDQLAFVNTNVFRMALERTMPNPLPASLMQGGNDRHPNDAGHKLISDLLGYAITLDTAMWGQGTIDGGTL